MSDVNLNSKWAKIRAHFPPHAGLALLVTSYALLVGVALSGIVGFTAILLGYNLETSWGGKKYSLKRPEIPARLEELGPNRSPPQPQPPVAPPNSKGSAGAAIPPTRNRGQNDLRIGEPLNLLPRVQGLGKAPFEVPESQGDERDPSDPPRPGAYLKDGQWFVIEFRKCKRYGNEPTYEACFVSPQSPNGRPLVKD